jgi:hypothetical protein
MHYGTYLGAPTHDVYKNGVGDGDVPDINRNLSGKWYGYGNSTCSAWLSYEGCTEEEMVKGIDVILIIL